MTAPPGTPAAGDPADPIRRRRADRVAFLERVYDASQADVGAFQDARDIADQMGIAIAEAERIVRYFEDRGYLKHAAGGGLTIRITAQGIDHVETRRAGD